MANTKIFLLLLWLALCVGLCRPWGDDSADIARAKAEDIEHGCAETMLYAKEKAESLAGWTHDKFHENKENARQATQNMVNAAEDTASKATETMKSAASGASEYASQKYGNAKGKVARMMSYDRTAEVYNEVDEYLRMSTDKAATMSRNAKDNVAESMGSATDRAAETYDQAKQRLGEAYTSAKDTMTEGAKAKYEEAKEKASQATGDLGAKMRTS